MVSSVVSATPRAILRYLELRGAPRPALPCAERYAFDDVVRLWLAAEALTGDRCLGVRVAALVPFGGFGVPEHLMVTSATLGAALRALLRFYGLVNGAQQLELHVNGRAARLIVFRSDGSPTLPSYADFVLASVANRMELALGGHTFAREIGDGAMRFDSEILRIPLPGADEELCRTMATMAEGRLATQPDIRDAVRELLGCGVSEGGAVAAKLGLSRRTLQRRLIEHGTTLRELVDAARRDEALRLVAAGRELKAVAGAVGFAEVRSFHRAFRRWTRQTPAEWRRVARGATTMARAD
ncbi:MAG TPA: helix-turn-helix domain-containing protein [Thermoanaerobaculia bacterium]|nr:helix-turn-helix domain-containing protein [Thermoanaerobaculia bacterium]